MEKTEVELLPVELLTPLTADFYPEDPGYDYEEETDGAMQLDGTDLTPYEAAIQEMVDKENAYGKTEGQTCNLMDYFNGSDSIKEKVKLAEVSVKKVDDVLYGCTTLTFKEYLDTEELNELCAYITGQYSDGWGEGFEQREIQIEGGCLYVHFWQGHETKFQQRTGQQEDTKIMPRTGKPKLKLLGHDGNIYSILADARRLLNDHGQADKAEEMFRKVQDSGDYNQALGIISQYVETELSVPSAGEKGSKVPGNKKKNRKEKGESR